METHTQPLLQNLVGMENLWCPMVIYGLSVVPGRAKVSRGRAPPLTNLFRLQIFNGNASMPKIDGNVLFLAPFLSKIFGTF